MFAHAVLAPPPKKRISANLNLFSATYFLEISAHQKAHYSILLFERTLFSFLFLESFGMVNAARVKRKLPSLLCDGKRETRANDNLFMRKRYRLSRLSRRKPERFNFLMYKLILVLLEIDREIEGF